MSQSLLTSQTINGYSAELSFPGSKKRYRISPKHLALGFLHCPSTHPASGVQSKEKGSSRFPGGPRGGPGWKKRSQDRVSESALPRGAGADSRLLVHTLSRVGGPNWKRTGRGSKKTNDCFAAFPLNNKASCKASGAVFVVPSVPSGGSGKGERSAVGRGSASSADSRKR